MLSFVYLVLFVGLEASRSPVNGDPKLIQLFTISRHGARTPGRYMPNFPCTKDTHPEEGFDVENKQLTPLGQNQTYHLGIHLREKYQVIPTDYSPKQFYFRASSEDRTLMSGQDCIMGLFKDTKLDDLPTPTFPLHSQDEDDDPIIQARRICSKVIKEGTDAIEKSKAYQDFAKEKAETIKTLSEKSGYTAKGKEVFLSNFSEIYDPIHAAWANEFKTCLFSGDDEHYNQDAMDIHNGEYAIDYTPNKTMGLLKMAPFIEEVVNRIELFIKDQKSNAAWNFYFGHDGNILSLHQLFEVPLTQPILFSSYWYFEVYQKDSAAENPYSEDNIGIKIGYHNFTFFLTHEAPGTPADYTEKVFGTEYASLKQLKEYMWDYKTWRKQCKLDDEGDTDSDSDSDSDDDHDDGKPTKQGTEYKTTVVILSISLSVVIVILTVALIITCCVRPRRADTRKYALNDDIPYADYK